MFSSRNGNARFAGTLAALLSILGQSVGSAATYTWNDLNGNSQMAKKGNWLNYNTITPASQDPTAGDTLVFASGTGGSAGSYKVAKTAGLGSGSGDSLGVASILFDGTPDTFAINSGNVLTLSSTATGTSIGNNGLTPMAALGRTAATSGTQTISVTTLQLGASGNRSYNMAIDGAGALNISSVVANASGGTSSLVKTGTGTLALTGANTYTGSTTINAGTLRVSTLANGGSNSSIGASGVAASNLVLGGGTLQYTGGNVTTNRGFTLTAATTSAIDVATAGTNLTISGTSVGTGNLTKTGAGTLTLSGVQGSIGTLAVNAGTLAIGSSDRIANTTALSVNGGRFSAGLFTDTVASLATAGTNSLEFSLNGASGNGSLTTTGNATLGGTTSVVLAGTTASSVGRYTVLTSGGSLTGSSSADTSGITYGNGQTAANWTLQSSGTSVYFAQKANQTFTASSSALRALVNSSVTVSGTLANTGGSSFADLTTSISGAGVTGITPANGTRVAAGSNVTVNGTLATQGTAGTQNWSLTNTDNSAATTTATANGSVQVVNARTFTPSGVTPIAVGNVRTNTNITTGSVTYSSTGLNAVTENATIAGFNTSGGKTLSLTSGSAAFNGAVATQTATYSVGGQQATAGAFSNTVQSVVNNEFSPTSNLNATISGNAYDFAQAKYTGTTVQFSPSTGGFIHKGAAGVTGTLAIGNQTVTSASFQDNLTVTGSTNNGAVGVTGFSNLAASTAGASTGTVTLTANTTTAGSLASTVSLNLQSIALAGTGLANGTAGTVGGGTVATSGSVYTGLATWTGTGGGNWGTFNGSGINTFGGNWSTDAGSPGLDPSFKGVDTATFAGNSVTGAVDIFLAGANPFLNAITFDNANTSYNIKQSAGGSQITMGGATPTISTLAGTHAIHSELAMDAATTFDVAAGALFEIHGTLSGNSGFTKTGAGTLEFYGNNTFVGDAYLTGGTVFLETGFDQFGGAANNVYLSGGVVLNLNGFNVQNTIYNNGGTIQSAYNPNNDVIIGGVALINKGTGPHIDGSYIVTSTGNGTFQDDMDGSATIQSGGVANFQGAILPTNPPVTSGGSVNVLAGGTATVAGAVQGLWQTAGTSTFNGEIQESVLVTGGTATFNGNTIAGSTVNVDGGTAYFNAGVNDIAHVTGPTAFAEFTGAIGSNASLDAEDGGTYTFRDGASVDPALGQIINEGNIVVNRTQDMTINANLIEQGSTTFAGTLTKLGSSTLTLNGANNSMTGDVSVQAGTLVLNGAFTAATTDVNVAAGASLGGSGSIAGVVSGGGLIGPGDSAGILTASQDNPAGGQDFAFEFTASGFPTWSDASASVNDVFRLTDTTMPFTQNLDGSNTINIYFGSTVSFPANQWQTFAGGFYTDNATDVLATAIANADVQYYFYTTNSGTGTVEYNGNNYVTLANARAQNLVPVGADFYVRTVQVPTADFASGSVSGGYVMEIVAVPEPSTLALIAVGLGSALVAYRRRRVLGRNSAGTSVAA